MIQAIFAERNQAGRIGHLGELILELPQRRDHPQQLAGCRSARQCRKTSVVMVNPVGG